MYINLAKNWELNVPACDSLKKTQRNITGIVTEGLKPIQIKVFSLFLQKLILLFLERKKLPSILHQKISYINVKHNQY